MKLEFRWGVVAMLAALAVSLPPAYVWLKGQDKQPASVAQLPQQRARLADFAGEEASADARRIANWVATTRDNANVDFVIVDKKLAKIFVFDGDARLRAASAVLLGGAPGDDSVPGIGLKPVSDVQPEERTTPAGRFVAERGTNLRGEDVVWVSYPDALSMHRVLTANPSERRLERLATPTPDDNRISAGCINVPVEFYEAFVRPAFATHRGAVYILPEVKSLEQVFSIPDGARA